LSRWGGFGALTEFTFLISYLCIYFLNSGKYRWHTGLFVLEIQIIWQVNKSRRLSKIRFECSPALHWPIFPETVSGYFETLIFPRTSEDLFLPIAKNFSRATRARNKESFWSVSLWRFSLFYRRIALFSGVKTANGHHTMG
jgi:hypothetical protein